MQYQIVTFVDFFFCNVLVYVLPVYFYSSLYGEE